MTVPLIVAFLLLAPALTHSSQSEAEDCRQYEAELQSRPDFQHKVMAASLPLPPDYVIKFVEQDPTKKRSFYWCQLKVNGGDGKMRIMQRYGHNHTHWWVTKGCGGWFTITACRHDPHTTNTNHTNSIDPTTTPTIITTTTTTTTVTPPHGGDAYRAGGVREKAPQQFSDLNSGALLSLVTWLYEQDSGNYNNIEEKLGAGVRYRVARSIDEEFQLEFGV